MNTKDSAGELAAIQKFLIPDDGEFFQHVEEKYPCLVDEYCIWIEAKGHRDSWALFRRYVAEYELTGGNSV